MMKINSSTQLYGVLGDPIEHSLSPLMHNAAFRHCQLNAVYLAFRVQPESLGLAFEGVRALGIPGVNLTIPLKQAAIEFVDEIPEDNDRAMQTINTVVNKNGELLGYNTDAAGFLTSLKEDLSFNPEGKNILLLGAGGASCAVAFALARAHAESILIHNRSQERADGLLNFASPHFPKTELRTVREEEIFSEQVDLVVNATSCGMSGNADVPIDLKGLKSKAAVYDLVYSPVETPFLKSARKLGLAAVNGLGMLAAQGALSFELWTGKKEGVRQAMREALNQCLS